MSGIILPRRQFLAGAIAALSAPAIVRVESLMKLPRPERYLHPLFRLGDFVMTAGEIYNRAGYRTKFPYALGIVTKIEATSRGDQILTVQQSAMPWTVKMDPSKDRSLYPMGSFPINGIAP